MNTPNSSNCPFLRVFTVLYSYQFQYQTNRAEYHAFIHPDVVFPVGDSSKLFGFGGAGI